MTRYVLTGAPGAGKTVLLRRLELAGYAVVEEAATDIIAAAHGDGDTEPENRPDFRDAILRLQQQRQAQPWAGPVQFVDRSAVCTWALARFLGREPSPELRRAAETAADTFHRTVLFVSNLGFCTPTAARRISFEDTLRFEAVHAEAYETFGFTLLHVPAAAPSQRLEQVRRALRLPA